MASIHITKIEVARRQIDAAIRLYLNKEDDLVIHTIAAAGYRILKDLLEKRSKNDFEELVNAGISSYVHALAEGLMSNAEVTAFKRDHPELFEMISPLIEHLKLTGIGSKPVDIRVSPLSSASKKQDWERMSRAANFLKHADRDYDKSISADDIDNAELISRASVAYVMYAHAPTPEMLGFYLLQKLDSDDWASDLDKFLLATAVTLRPLSQARRLRNLKKIIRHWRKADPFAPLL